MDYLKRHQRLGEVFDCIIVSADVGATKTDARIFRVALRSLGVDAADSVFIDNTASNLIAANAIGMKTVWFDDKRNDVAGLAQRLKMGSERIIDALSARLMNHPFDNLL